MQATDKTNHGRACNQYTGGIIQQVCTVLLVYVDVSPKIFFKLKETKKTFAITPHQ